MIVGFFVLVGIGSLVILKNWTHLQIAWVSRSWVITQGTICHTTIDCQGTGGSFSLRRQGSFFANVIYQYVVNDKKYSNDRRCFGNDLESESQALSTAAHYPEGSTVSVAYNPQNPKQSVLEPGLRFSQWVPLGVGAMLMSGGWAGLLIYGYPWLLG